MNTASLYIHIPFCAEFCDYCDFYSVNKSSHNEDYIDAFLNALIKDIKYQINCFSVKKIPTAYIGGGTPSILGNKLQILFDALKNIPAFKPVEFTIEANPESITKEFLSMCKDGGVNRLSLGVQTFNEASRIAVNRAGKADILQERLALASKFYNCSLSVDLITGLPFQTEKNILDDVAHIITYKPVHLSLYSLTVESETKLAQNIKKNTVVLPDRDVSDSLWITGRDAIINAGYKQYEISNFAINGKRCLHNLRYWQLQGWLGAGPSASGTIINEKAGVVKRFTYAKDVEAYIKNPAIQSAVCEDLDKLSFIKECLLMGFRCKDGPDPYLFIQRFGSAVESFIPNTLKKWHGKDKMLFLNHFLHDVFTELDSKK